MYQTMVKGNPLTLEEDGCREYFNNTTTGVIYLDGKQRIKSLNGEAERICRMTCETAKGQDAKTAFLHMGEAFLRIFSDGGEEADSGTVRIVLNHQSMYLHINRLQLQDFKGEAAGYIVIMQDVSAVRAALKQIHTTKLLMSLGEVAAGVAHHVRTPLTTIGGYLQTMLSRMEDDKYTVKKDVLEGLLGEVSYINDVVKELVMFAKPSVLKKPGVDVNKVLNDALLMTFRHYGSEGIQLKRQIIQGLPTINGDASLLQQALANILQNAMEAIGEEGTLTVKTWRDYENNMLVLSVSDTGDGILPEILPKVFEPFYTTKLDRLGLGLPVAYRIIAEHAGFIHFSLSAKESTGTTVRVYLPLVEEKNQRSSVMYQQVLNLQ